MERKKSLISETICYIYTVKVEYVWILETSQNKSEFDSV
jgi:ribosomal protein L23